MAEVLGQRERSGVPTGGDALEIGLIVHLEIGVKTDPCPPISDGHLVE